MSHLSLQVSVIIPAHNPRRDYLARVLAALAAQTLPKDEWELVIVDNNSQPALSAELARQGHAAGRVLREGRTGLTAARLAGFAATTGEIIVLVDDDNVLAPDYLATARRLALENDRLGAWSGRVDLEFDTGVTPPPKEWWGYLAYRQPVAQTVSTEIDHHDSTPWGAGMCIRRAVTDAYRVLVQADTSRTSLDLQGKRLIYGGDTDIAYTGCDRGFSKGVFPDLRLLHLIPAERCTDDFFNRTIEGRGYSEQLHRLIRHGRMRNPRRSLRRWLGDWWHAWKAGRPARLELAARHRGFARAWRELPHP
jgi:glycosyltransferase involved in cell wall biosynthesis